MTFLRRWGQPWSPGDNSRVNHAVLDVVTPPVEEPVSLQEVQRFLHIDYDNEDPTLTLLTAAARQRVEGYLRRSLMTQTRVITLDWGPAWVELPYPPIQSVTQITVLGLDMSTVVAPTTAYFFNANARRVMLRPASVWPVHIAPGGWTCTYVAGYGTDPSAVPAAIKLAILNMVAFAFDNRGQMGEILEKDKNALVSYRVEGPPFRIAKGVEPPELMS